MTQQHYTGSCQCGAVGFEVDLDLDRTFACNCSRCRRLGSVLAFAPADDFHLTSDGPTTEYTFNRNVISHRFCPVCGVQTFALGERDGAKIVAVNVNCLDGVDSRALGSQQVDGASR